jgi:beta-galactosidase
VAVRAVGRGRVEVRNRRAFADLTDLRGAWELRVGDRVVRRGTWAPVVAAGASRTLPQPVEAPAGDDEAVLTFRWTTRRDMPWAAAGHLVAWDEIVLRPRRPTVRPSRGLPASDGPQATGAGRVDALLAGPVRLNLWRAAVDNDGFKLLPHLRESLGVGGVALDRWLEQGIPTTDPEALVVHRVRRTVESERSVLVEHEVEVPEHLADLPRIGVIALLRPGAVTWRWRGRGPAECYPDRSAGALLGVWDAAPDELPYIVPQEFGLRTDCRWAEIHRADDGSVLRIEAVAPVGLHLSVTHHTPAQLFAAADVTELERSRSAVLCIDVAHRGLGTASCGPDVDDAHRIAPGVHRFVYRLRAL